MARNANPYSILKSEDISKGASSYSIELGDATQSAIFYPQVKLSFWDNECNFSIRFVDTQYERAKVDILPSGTVEWEKGIFKSRLYEKPNDQFEFEVELASKPSSNLIQFTIQDKEFNYYYQPPLSQEEIDEGCSRSEDVIGSYAVYHKSRKHNKDGSKKYFTGKAFHIYRPWAEDANGVRVWCDLNIEAGMMTITVPQQFLDSAVYPVIVDPTLGKTSFGASSSTRAANAICAINAGNAVENGTVTSISIGIDGNGVGTVNAKGVLFNAVGGGVNTIVSNGVSPSVLLPSSAGGLYTTINYSSSPSIVSGSPYAISAVSDATLKYYYDSTPSFDGFFHDANNYTTPIDTPSVTNTARDLSMYITYTAAGGSSIKTVMGLAKASVKTFKDLAIASVKTVEGLT